MPNDAARPIRVAVVGRPNVGKSTLVNRLLGEERLLTGPEAGITRDTISVPLDVAGARSFSFTTPPACGASRRIDEKLEKLSVGDALEAIRFADVVVVLMDAQQAFEEQDLRIADLIEREGRAIVHRHEQVGPRRGGARRRRQAAQRGRSLAAAGEGRADRRAVGTDRRGARPADAGGDRRAMRSGTSACRPPRSIAGSRTRLGANPPPAVSGRRLRLNYITQAKARPPSFVIFCTRADAVPEAYLRYLVNELREAFDLPGTPIRLHAAREEEPVRRAGQEEVVTAPPLSSRRRQAAFIFVFVTVVLDMLAVGIIIPVLPQLVLGFVESNHASAAESTACSRRCGR